MQKLLTTIFILTIAASSVSANLSSPATTAVHSDRVRELKLRIDLLNYACSLMVAVPSAPVKTGCKR